MYQVHKELLENEWIGIFNWDCVDENAFLLSIFLEELYSSSNNFEVQLSSVVILHPGLFGPV